jgi:hypothetical protein
MDGPQVRCSNCGALAAPEAEWCGQCWLPLTPSESRDAARDTGPSDPPPPRPSGPVPPHQSEPVPRPVTGTTVPLASSVIERAPDGLTWRCPSCGRANPIDERVCAWCGTPFAHLLRDPEVQRSTSVTPAAAVMRSLVLPGLGHWSLGRRADALSRFVISAWSLGAALMILTTGASSRGPLALVTVFLLALGALWASSALDAYRIASGLDPIVSQRMLLWGSAGLVLFSVVIGALLILPSGGGR